MKPLIVTAKAKKPEDIAVPNLDKNDPEYKKKLNRVLKYKTTQPEVYNRIMFWD
jgi:hypothetical protein